MLARTKITNLYILYTESAEYLSFLKTPAGEKAHHMKRGHLTNGLSEWFLTWTRDRGKGPMNLDLSRNLTIMFI